MIGYVTLGTQNIQKAAAFYDALYAEMGGRRMMEFGEGFIVWGTDPKAAMLSICHPYDQKAATVGNGVMVGLLASSPEQVQSLHAKALALGASDEGAPGQRGDNFYAGYFRDLDGNKLNFFCVT